MMTDDVAVVLSDDGVSVQNVASAADGPSVLLSSRPRTFHRLRT